MSVRLSFAAVSILFFASTLPQAAAANIFVGDLVYCDAAGDKGRYEPAAGDYPIDGVGVRIVCVDDAGAVCMDETTTTGTIHPSVDPGKFASALGGCSDVGTFDILDPAQHAGRYLFETIGPCGSAPASCQVTVDETTLPDSCDQLVTPTLLDLPIDGNADGDHCDPEDGPFAEGQLLGGDGTTQLTCEGSASPGPGNAVHTTRHENFDAHCSLYADFGYMPEEIHTSATRTPGFWKNHPDAIAQFLPISFCGEEVADVCRAAELLSQKGGGLKKFTRHAVAATFNCEAMGCGSDIRDAIETGSAACGAGDETMPYTLLGDVLDAFNNSGTDLDASFDFGPADPKLCR